MTDDRDLERFVRAQDPVWPAVTAELRAGRKRSHWIWFVFPQVRGLGRSRESTTYGIADLAEARAYLAHPVLGVRLAEATDLLLAAPGSDAEAILGSIDALKVRSSMTLSCARTRPLPGSRRCSSGSSVDARTLSPTG